MSPAKPRDENPVTLHVGDDVRQLIEGLSYSLLRISHGTTSGPTGLEMLSMAISGEGIGVPPGPAIREGADGIANGLSEVAQAIESGLSGIAHAIRYHADSADKAARPTEAT